MPSAGKYSIKAYIQDICGNKSDVVVSNTFYYDQTASELTAVWTGTSDEKLTSNNTTLSISFDVSVYSLSNVQ